MNKYEHYDDQKEEFAADFFEDNLSKTPYKPDKEELERIEIFIEMLNKEAGIDEVSSRLRERKLRGIYVRCPIELILWYCFSNNQNSSIKYNLESFRKLCGKIKQQYKVYGRFFKKKSNYSDETGENDIIENGSITLGSIYNYLRSCSSDSDVLLPPDPPPFTLIMMSLIDDIQTTSNTEKQFLDNQNDFVSCYHDYLDSLTFFSNSIRFFVIKYLYLSLISQIIMFKSLLREKSSKSIENILDDFYKKYYDLSGEELAQTIKAEQEEYFADAFDIKKYIIQTESFEKLITETLFDENGNPRITKEYVEVNEFEKGYHRWQYKYDINLLNAITKSLYKCATNYLMLFGAPVNKENGGIGILSNPQKTLSCLSEMYLTFTPRQGADQKDFDEHRRIANAIENMSVQEFAGYRIDFPRVFDSFFENASKENDTSPEIVDNKDEFVKDILLGNSNLSRSAFLFFLASANEFIKNGINACSAHDSEIKIILKEAKLNTTEINRILERVCYPTLEQTDESDEIQLDKLYELFFDDEVPFVNFIREYRWENFAKDNKENLLYYKNPITLDFSEVLFKEKWKRLVDGADRSEAQ